MDTTSLGIHHVTLVTANAQRNVDFYAGFLGLRLVKRTVPVSVTTSKIRINVTGALNSLARITEIEAWGN